MILMNDELCYRIGDNTALGAVELVNKTVCALVPFGPRLGLSIWVIVIPACSSGIEFHRIGKLRRSAAAAVKLR